MSVVSRLSLPAIAAATVLAVPLAVVTALPQIGAALVRLGVGRLPEETDPPAALRTLRLPAIEAAQGRALPQAAARSGGHA